MSTVTVESDQLNPGGAKRMARLIKDCGMKREHALCPACGGHITASDMKNIATRATRYSIACDHDCEGVYAPSVKLAVAAWKELFDARQSTEGREE